MFILEIYTFLVTLKFELQVISNRILYNFVLCKYIYSWYHRYFSLELFNSLKCCEPLTVLFAIFFICNLENHLRLTRSYERFIYRKDKEIGENRLKVITKAFPDGIIILDRNKQILFLNAKSKTLLKCTREEIPQILRTIEYSDGKKISNLLSSYNLIDDLTFLIDRNETDEVTLGVSCTNEINLE